jgi:tetratricopeptide (TPR) repeat protein
MNKKKIVAIIVVIAVVVSIPSSVFAYNYYNFNKQVELGEEALENENFEDADKYFREALNYSKSHDDEINEDISLVESLKRSKELYEEGITTLEAKKYLEAIDIFKSISEEKSKYYDQAQSKISESRNLFIEDNIVLAKSKAEEKKFDEGIVFLNEVLKLDENNQVALDLREQYNKEIEKIKAETEAKAKADAEEKEQISKKKSTNKTESTVGSQSNPTTSKLNMKIDGGWFSLEISYL